MTSTNKSTTKAGLAAFVLCTTRVDGQACEIVVTLKDDALHVSRPFTSVNDSPDKLTGRRVVKCSGTTTIDHVGEWDSLDKWPEESCEGLNESRCSLDTGCTLGSVEEQLEK